MIRNFRWVHVVVFTFSALTLSCTEDTVEPCDLWTASAIVSVQVTDMSGAPIANTEVEVKIAAGNQCDGGERWVRTQRGVTNNAGQFSIELELGNQRGVRCIGVLEANSGTLVRDTVEFTGGCDDTRPPGFTNVDLSI